MRVMHRFVLVQHAKLDDACAGHIHIVICVAGDAELSAGAGTTPFAGGQFQAFLGRVAGLLALQQLLRPIRFSCAVALTPFVDRMMSALQQRFNIPKRTAFGIMLVSLAAGTLTGFAIALSSATALNMPI